MRTIILLLFAVPCFSQALEKHTGNELTYKRNYHYQGSEYIISFTIAPGALKFVPAENNPLEQTHFEATVHVFKKNHYGNFEPIDGGFRGWYTHDGCWEDDPEYLIKRAIRLERIINKVE